MFYNSLVIFKFSQLPNRYFTDPNDLNNTTIGVLSNLIYNRLKPYIEERGTSINKLISSSSSRTSDGQSSLADKCCSPLQIREAGVELLGLQCWLGPGPHSQFFIQLTPL